MIVELRKSCGQKINFDNMYWNALEGFMYFQIIVNSAKLF